MVINATRLCPCRTPRQRRRDLEADLQNFEANRAQLAEREALLSTRAKKAESREAEVRRLRREADEDRAGLEKARQACLDRERGLSGMEEALSDREVGVGLWGVVEAGTEAAVEVRLVFSEARHLNSIFF